MGGVDLSDKMKVSYQVGRKSQFLFYLKFFFDFVHNSVVNSKIIYDKMDSTVDMSAMTFSTGKKLPQCIDHCSSKKIQNGTFICCLSYNALRCFQKERNCFYLHHYRQQTGILH